MSPSLPKLRILAVDDNRTNLHILKVFLAKLGHEAICAENGRDALEIFQSDPPDLILLDIMMPGMNGFETARRIKAHASEHWIPIIFLSALNRDENLLEGLEAGGDDYLTKPINFVVLEAKLRSMQRALLLQQKAAESMRRTQAISDAVMEAIITIDSSGKIISGNTACTDMFGWEPAELLDAQVSILMPEPHRSNHGDYLRRYLDGGEPHVIGVKREVEAMRKSGEIFPAELGISEIRVDKQRLFIGVFRDISQQKATELELRSNADQLRAYYEQNEGEQSLAKALLEKLLHRASLKDPVLHYSVKAADHFSGDIVAATRSAQGKLYTLLADATGHGLAAAISVLPVLALFYRLCSDDTDLDSLVREINTQLCQSMPAGRFVAATLVWIDEENRNGKIWIGGMPETMLLDSHGNHHQSFHPTHLPLGITEFEKDEQASESFSWDQECQLLIGSDGLFEAENEVGLRFELTGALSAVQSIPPAQRLAALDNALFAHLGGRRASDDVSYLLIDCH